MTTPEQPRQMYRRQAEEHKVAGEAAMWVAVDDLLDLLDEAQARPAVASEGLDELVQDIGQGIDGEPYLDNAGWKRAHTALKELAALASDAGSVGALDFGDLSRAPSVSLSAGSVGAHGFVERSARAIYDDYEPSGIGSGSVDRPPWTPGSVQEKFYRRAAHNKAERIAAAYDAERQGES